MKLVKHPNNPILAPNPDNAWESLCVCNPGAWYEDGRFYLLYRAAGDDEAHQIHFGLAVSEDGFNFRRDGDTPVLSPSSDGPDAGCVEDARIVKYGDAFFVTYAYRPFPPGRYWTFGPDEVLSHDVPDAAPPVLRGNIANSGLLLSRDLRSFKRLGRITSTNLDDRDVILFPEKIGGRYAMLHRPKQWIGSAYGCTDPSIWISWSDNLMEWGESVLVAQGSFGWERKIGGSTPPIKTEDGWLTLYHAVDEAGIYRVGVMLLDLENPAIVRARATDWIMEPEHEYEFEGFYKGCVFPTGNVVVDDTLYVYYGGADKYCCAATCSLSALLAFVKRFPVA